MYNVYPCDACSAIFSPSLPLLLYVRMLVRALCNTIRPSDTVRAGLMDRLHPLEYNAGVSQWQDRLRHRSASKLQTSPTVPLRRPPNLSINADPPSSGPSLSPKLHHRHPHPTHDYPQPSSVLT